MKKTILLTLTLLFSACSSKTPPPVQLEDNPSTTVNHMLLNKPKNIIPKDGYLKQSTWGAKMTVIKNSKYYFKNDIIIKAFYLAHHAKTITIKGDANLIKRYKNYLKRNGVTAYIALKPNIYSKRKSSKVEFWFSHKEAPIQKG